MVQWVPKECQVLKEYLELLWVKIANLVAVVSAMLFKWFTVTLVAFLLTYFTFNTSILLTCTSCLPNYGCRCVSTILLSIVSPPLWLEINLWIYNLKCESGSAFIFTSFLVLQLTICNNNLVSHYFCVSWNNTIYNYCILWLINSNSIIVDVLYIVMLYWVGD